MQIVVEGGGVGVGGSWVRGWGGEGTAATDKEKQTNSWEKVGDTERKMVMLTLASRGQIDTDRWGLAQGGVSTAGCK